MEDGGRGLFQATCITATVYAVLFLAHIVAAAKDMDLAFRTVAALITVLTFSVGTCIRFVGRIKRYGGSTTSQHHRTVFRPSVSDWLGMGVRRTVVRHHTNRTVSSDCHRCTFHRP
jgi:preprotein translocase subunit SecF